MKYIYRICNQREATNMPGVTKSQCLKNFLKEAGTVNTTVIADNCTPEMVAYLKNKGVEKILETSLGNSQSFAKALDVALELDDSETVYMVEDYYLHKAGWPFILNEGLEIANFVTLYDHPDKYMKNGPNALVQHGGELTRVLLTKSTHWKETNSTTMTFATKVKTLREHHEVMRHYLDLDKPRDYLMWREVLYNASLVSPMPGYSTHCHEPWCCPFFKT